MADPTERNFDPNDDVFESSSRANANQSGLEPSELSQPDATETDAADLPDTEASTSVSDNEIESAPDTPTTPAVVGEEQLAETEDERAAREAEEELLWIFQATVFDRSNQKIGRVGQVYLDDQTQAPNWVTVKTGLFGMKEYFIPLDGSERAEKRITVPFDKALVLASPRTEVDQNLSPSEEDALYNHYRVEGKATDVVALEDGVVVPEAADAAVTTTDTETATGFDALLADDAPAEGTAFDETAATEVQGADNAFEAPPSEASAYETPASEAYESETPESETPKFEIPVFDAPIFDAPGADDSAADEPAGDEPAADEPSAFEAPKFETPDFDNPDFDNPEDQNSRN